MNVKDGTHFGTDAFDNSLSNDEILNQSLKNLEDLQENFDDKTGKYRSDLCSLQESIKELEASRRRNSYQIFDNLTKTIGIVVPSLPPNVTEDPGIIDQSQQNEKFTKTNLAEEKSTQTEKCQLSDADFCVTKKSSEKSGFISKMRALKPTCQKSQEEFQMKKMQPYNTCKPDQRSNYLNRKTHASEQFEKGKFNASERGFSVNERSLRSSSPPWEIYSSLINHIKSQPQVESCIFVCEDVLPQIASAPPYPLFHSGIDELSTTISPSASSKYLDVLQKTVKRSLSKHNRVASLPASSFKHISNKPHSSVSTRPDAVASLPKKHCFSTTHPLIDEFSTSKVNSQSRCDLTSSHFTEIGSNSSLSNKDKAILFEKKDQDSKMPQSHFFANESSSSSNPFHQNCSSQTCPVMTPPHRSFHSELQSASNKKVEKAEASSKNQFLFDVSPSVALPIFDSASSHSIHQSNTNSETLQQNPFLQTQSTFPLPLRDFHAPSEFHQKSSQKVYSEPTTPSTLMEWSDDKCGMTTLRNPEYKTCNQKNSFLEPFKAPASCLSSPSSIHASSAATFVFDQSNTLSNEKLSNSSCLNTSLISYSIRSKNNETLSTFQSPFQPVANVPLDRHPSFLFL